MSIIYDALQKTQAQRENQSTEIDSKGSPERHLEKTIIVVLSALIIIAVVTRILIATHSKISVPVVAKKLASSPSVYVLNGLFLSDDEKMAMINNHMLHVGDIIENMNVVSIEEEGVKLQNGNYKVTLLEKETKIG